MWAISEKVSWRCCWRNGRSVRLRRQTLSTVPISRRFVRHVYPVYFGFKGGKAVSVATGTIIAIKPVLILPLLAVFFIVFLCSKMVSLASICCAAAYPAVTFLYFHFVAGRDVVLTTCCAAVIGGLVIWLHRSNIQRIKNGTEYKFGRKKK